MLPGHNGGTLDSRLTHVVKPESRAAPGLHSVSKAKWRTCGDRQPPTPLHPQQPVRAPADVLAQLSAVSLRSTVEQHARELVQEQALQDTFWIVDLGMVQKLKQDWDSRCAWYLVIWPFAFATDCHHVTSASQLPNMLRKIDPFITIDVHPAACHGCSRTML